MITVLKGSGDQLEIGPDLPTRLIGERINPTGRKVLARSLREGEFDFIEREAVSQVRQGADIIDINVGTEGVDQKEVLPRAVERVAAAVDVPICLDTSDPKALATALPACPGKPLVNSVNGEKKSLEAVLPLVAKHQAAVVALAMDDEGIPRTAEGRLQVIRRIVEAAEHHGIPPEDVVVDCLAMAVSTDQRAGLTTLDAIRMVREELGLNMTLGASNISFGLPQRHVLTGAFLVLAVNAGVNCPIVDPAQTRQVVLAADLCLGRDDFAMRYLKGYRDSTA